MHEKRLPRTDGATKELAGKHTPDGLVQPDGAPKQRFQEIFSFERCVPVQACPIKYFDKVLRRIMTTLNRSSRRAQRKIVTS
jgi:hypothetical protein